MLHWNSTANQHIITFSLHRSLLPRIRRLIDLNYVNATTSTTGYILITATRRNDILSDNSLPLATFFASQNDCRMEKSHIGFLLRQKVIELETDSQEANDAMIVAVNWLNRLSIHFEEFCQRIDPELHFSPKPFNHPVLVRINPQGTLAVERSRASIVVVGDPHFESLSGKQRFLNF